MTSMRADMVGGISSGYMKRLSIGVEIIALPYILFLGERPDNAKCICVCGVCMATMR